LIASIGVNIYLYKTTISLTSTNEIMEAENNINLALRGYCVEKNEQLVVDFVKSQRRIRDVAIQYVEGEKSLHYGYVRPDGSWATTDMPIDSYCKTPTAE